MEQNAKRQRKLILGVVCARNSAKTGKLKIETMEKHRLYNKYMRKTKYITFHDEKDETNVGDMVQIVETRPISKTKGHNLVSIVKKADVLASTSEV